MVPQFWHPRNCSHRCIWAKSFKPMARQTSSSHTPPQKKCSMLQILSILRAVLTRLFWRPLSVNHLHLTNLIQHFLEMFPSQYPACWHRAHRHAGSTEQTQTPLIFMTITNTHCHVLCCSASSNIITSAQPGWRTPGRAPVRPRPRPQQSAHVHTEAAGTHTLETNCVRQGETGSQYG